MLSLDSDARTYLEAIIDHIGRRVRHEDLQAHAPHAVVVVAEGVHTALEKLKSSIVERDTFKDWLKKRIEEKVVDARGKKVPIIGQEPRHYIRSVPANAHDQIYCERLGALAVDSALAGYTDCMISQWMTEFVLIPLNLVTVGKKSINIHGILWKQVANSTGQPLSVAERESSGEKFSHFAKGAQRTIRRR